MTPLEIGIAVVKALAALVPEIAKAIEGMGDEDIAKLIASAKAAVPGHIDTSRDEEIRNALVDPGGAPRASLSPPPPPNPYAEPAAVLQPRVRIRSLSPNSLHLRLVEAERAIVAAKDALFESELGDKKAP